MGITQIIGILTGILGIPGLLPSNKLSSTIALVADAYAVYNDIQGHKGLAQLSLDVKTLLNELVAEGVNLGAFIPAFDQIAASVSNYTSGQLTVLDANFRQIGEAYPGKIYAVLDGGDAATKISQVFDQGYQVLPPV